MADQLALLDEAFRGAIWRLVGQHDLEATLGGLSNEQAWGLGRTAARHAIAPLIWRARAGQSLETEVVRELLGVSRQALAQRVQNGTILGLPGSRTTLYPTWQFKGNEVRDCVPVIIKAFRESLDGAYDPLLVASWAQTSQPELDDRSPADWLSEEDEEQKVELAALRAADAAGQ